MKNGKRTIKLLHFPPVVLLFCFILIMLPGCKTYDAGSETPGPFEITGPFQEQSISPDSSHEECPELLQGQVIEYAFKTSRPVDFNIHYHGKDKIHYPVQKNNVSAWKGAFTTTQEMFDNKDQEYFCMMWENHNTRQVELTFTYDVSSN